MKTVWNFVFIFLVFLGGRSWSQETTELSTSAADSSSIGMPAPKVNDLQDKKNWSIEAAIDVAAGSSKLEGEPEIRNTYMREASFGLSYQHKSYLSLETEIVAEDFSEETEVYLSQLFVEMGAPEYFVSAKVGQMFYPVGWFNEQDKYFLNQPNYYRSLFRGRRGIDTGGVATIFPFRSSLLALQGGCFEGKVFRSTDSQVGTAEQQPCFYSARLNWKALQFFATHFEHDFAYYDKVVANGVGFKIDLSYDDWQLQGGLWGEAFSLTTTSPAIAETVTNGGVLYPYLRWNRFQLGYRWSPQTTKVANTLGKLESEIDDQAFRAQVWVFPEVSFIYEKQYSYQKGGVTLVDEQALRFLFEVTL